MDAQMTVEITATPVKIVEKGHNFMAAFTDNDGYFHVASQDMRQVVRQAQAARREISFRHDRDMNIVEIL